MSIAGRPSNGVAPAAMTFASVGGPETGTKPIRWMVVPPPPPEPLP